MLTSKLDRSQEWIVLDHQPSGYENVKKAGWGYLIRTERHSEYVILNIVPE